MTYTTNQLISDAYYGAGIVSREFETVSGSQISDGLRWLNDIIAEKRVADSLIPYETTYNFVSKIGVGKYFIPDLIKIDTLTFLLGNVRYPMTFTKRDQYFGSGRVENITTLPCEYYFERQMGGADIYIYFKPDKNYTFEVHGLFNLSSVSLNQDLSANVSKADLGVPTFYGLGELKPGQLVVNNVDIMGEYSNIGALTNYINSGIIPGVSANIVVNDVVLSSLTKPPVPIYVITNGYAPNGTRSVGTATTVSTTNLFATYNNGNSGVGATLSDFSITPSALIINGYAVGLNERVLIPSQVDPTQNGIYTQTTFGDDSTPWVLTRATGYNKSVNIQNGDLINITNGFSAGETYVQTNEVQNIGFDKIVFTVFNALTFSNFSTIQLPDYQVFNPVGFDTFYIPYLRYCLELRECAEYNYVVPDGVRELKNYYESLISKKSRVIDLQMQKVSTLQKRDSYGWAQINLGKGWCRPW